MEVNIKQGIDDTISSKSQIFHEKTKDGIVLFEKDKFPRITDSTYSPLMFNIINCSFLVKNDLNGFFSAIEPFVEFNQQKNIFTIEESKVNEFKKTISNAEILKGIEMLEIMPANVGQDHQGLLNAMGANTNSLMIKDNEGSLNLQNFNSKINKKFDITFSNNLLHDNESIEDENHSNVYRGMEIYAILSSLTKKNRYSIHCHGSYISSLYGSYFQFLGFKVVDYFRVETGPYNFGIILKKFNDKKITNEEFEYLYLELKKRNPIRYR